MVHMYLDTVGAKGKVTLQIGRILGIETIYTQQPAQVMMGDVQI